MLTPEDIAKAKQMFKDGKNTADIAEELGVAEYVVYNGRPYLDSAYLALPGRIIHEPKRNRTASRVVVITPSFVRQ